ncbi:MAG: hypothetical protein ABJC09_03015 [Terriglobia bacterium]
MKSLLEIFYSPGAVFAGLPERRAAWIAPLIANCLVILLMTVLVPHYLGRANMMRRQLENLHLPSERVEAAIAGANSPGRVIGGYVGAVVATAVVLLVIAGVMFAFGLMTRRAPRFATMFSMVSLAFFPYWLVTTLMTAAVLMTAADPAALDAQNLLATNAGAYMDRNALAKGLYSLMTSLDVLSFVEIGLLSYGFAKVTRVSVFYGLAAVLGLWLLYVSTKMAISLMM